VKLRRIAIVLALIALVGWGGIAYEAYRLALPDRRPVAPRPADLSARDIEFTSHGVTVRGWFVRADQPRGVILLMHGIHANRSQMIDRARFLRRAGYSSLLYDSRAHGESGGTAITFGHLESDDARAALALARSFEPGKPAGVIAVSLGGAAALLADPPLDVRAIIAESVYPDIDGAISNRVRNAVGCCGPLGAPLLLAMFRPRLGFSASELRPIDHVKKLTTPKFFLFGTDDHDTTLRESVEMFDAAAEPKRMWAVEGARHVDLHGFARKRYEQCVLDFLDRYVGSILATNR